MSAYQTLKQRWHRAARIHQASGVLGWDQAVLMPEQGAQARGEQLSTLALLAHDQCTRPDMPELLKQAFDERLDQWDSRNLELIDREWRKGAVIPADLVEGLAQSAAAAETAWGKARDAGDFALVKGELKHSFDLTKQRAEILSQEFGEDPYDMLMDDFEPGLKAARVDEIFGDYADFLPDFLAAVQNKQSTEPAVISPQGPFNLSRQEALGRELVQAVGFDFKAGRLDVSRHPFCGGYTTDIRITTRYDEADFTKALMGVLHETGHAMYEAGLPADYLTQPVGAAAGLAAHESQSLLIEMQASRSDGFLSYLIPKARAAFAGVGDAWSDENLTRLYRHVAPGLIRVDADEVTYPAHVILRYELERALFAGDLEIEDLPAAFADGLEAKLGVRPEDDRLGVMQDIHWYSGGFGYFPTYTLGAMAAAQLFAAAKEDLATQGRRVEADLGVGDFKPLMGWLKTHVHGKGSLMNTDDILRSATGRPLDPKIFQSHLRQRYLGEIS